jgi:hypothetical protein
MAQTYKIFARVNAEHRDGYSVYDWFDGDVLDCEFATAADAEAAARAAYKGPDVDGVECIWEIG